MSNIPFFVVNLTHDVEKKAHMSNLATSLGVTFEYIAAVNGKSLTRKQIEAVYDRTLSVESIGRGLSLGELGCALSHLHIYQKMITENIDVAVILEDDVDISADIHNIMSSVDSFPENWELMLLGYYSAPETERMSLSSFRGRHPILSTYRAVRLVEETFGTHGYMINLQGAKKLVLDLNRIIKPIDHYTCSEVHINMFALTPRVITLNNKFKQMGCIESDRNFECNQVTESQRMMNIINSVWLFFKRRKIIYFLATLPRRLLPLKKFEL